VDLHQRPAWKDCFSVDGTRNCRSVNSLFFLAAVNVVIWVGLFFYLWRLDRRLTERERER